MVERGEWKATAPFNGKHVGFHQDLLYWGLNPGKVLTAWIAIDDVDGEMP